LTHADRKLVGSAQRRAGGRALQHGSMPIGPPDRRFWRVLGADGVRAAKVTANLEDALGRRPSIRVLCAHLAAGVAESLGLPARWEALSVRERRRAAAMACRHANPGWVRRI
jgi:lipoate-protein ligase A